MESPVIHSLQFEHGTPSSWLNATWKRNQANAWELTVHFLPRRVKSTSFSCWVRRREPILFTGLLAEGGPLISDNPMVWTCDQEVLNRKYAFIDLWSPLLVSGAFHIQTCVFRPGMGWGRSRVSEIKGDARLVIRRRLETLKFHLNSCAPSFRSNMAVPPLRMTVRRRELQILLRRTLGLWILMRRRGVQ